MVCGSVEIGLDFIKSAQSGIINRKKEKSTFLKKKLLTYQIISMN